MITYQTSFGWVLKYKNKSFLFATEEELLEYVEEHFEGGNTYEI